MPIKYIGKKSAFTGNLLFEILNRLKNHGLGRVVVRNSYKKFPEMSFYIIRKVIPMRESIGPGPDELVYGKVWVDEVYRDRKLEGLRLLAKETWLPDYYLIPRHEEDKYLNFKPKEVVKILPKYVEVPPVFKLLMKQQSPAEEPKLEAVYEDQYLPEHLIYKIAEEGETPNHKLKVQIPEEFKFMLKY